jgi:hypothetical protein
MRTILVNQTGVSTWRQIYAAPAVGLFPQLDSFPVKGHHLLFSMGVRGFALAKGHKVGGPENILGQKRAVLVI